MEGTKPPTPPDVTIPTNTLGAATDGRAKMDARLKEAVGGDLELVQLQNVSVKLRPPTGGRFFRALRIAGRDTHIVPLIEAMMCVAVVNGDPQPQITSVQQVETLCDRLTRVGIEAVMEWYNTKLVPEIAEIMVEYPDLPPDSPEFQQAVQARREANLKN